MTERRSRIYWTIRHPTVRTGNPGMTTYVPRLHSTKSGAWSAYTCLSRFSMELRGRVKKLEAEGYRAVKVRIVEEPGQ